ncbi:hypothetical protein AB9R84_06050 [Oceanimonas smirnovii]|uniref:type I-G CRISPR-associated protein, Cas3-extension family n=1 Tax=Oceanimonas smirnovii TaxID=264574 RepID=UPI003AAD2ECE
MTELALTGLTPNSPFNFMAALGLMRLLAEDNQRCELRLSWRQSAVLHGVGKEELLELLYGHMEKRYQAIEFNWADSARSCSPEIYQEALRNSDDRGRSFLAAWGTDGRLTKNGHISTSRLDMTSGQQKLIRELRKLAWELAETPELLQKSFEKGLFEQHYEEGQSAFGLDPATLRQHATEARAPTKMKPSARKAALWLVAESFPCHPVIVSNQQAVTLGTYRDSKGAAYYYYYPIWRNFSLSFSELNLLRQQDVQSLGQRPDITEVWSSEFIQTGKYGALRPACRIK